MDIEFEKKAFVTHLGCEHRTPLEVIDAFIRFREKKPSLNMS